jgi:hypothetical protein
VCLDRDVTLADVGATIRAILKLTPDSRSGAGHPIAELIAP